KDLLDLPGGRVVSDVCLVDRAGEFVLLEDGSKVDEGALDGGDRDAAPLGGIGEIRSARPVCDHAFDPALGWGKNFGQWRGALQEAKEVRRRSSGQERPFTAGLDRGDVAGFEAWGLVAHPENTAMNADQRADRDTVLEFIPRYAGPK
ncbi:MAG TPA: hypothetical protein VI028_05225, partial [Solirubrobacterales bacterium]